MRYEEKFAVLYFASEKGNFLSTLVKNLTEKWCPSLWKQPQIAQKLVCKTNGSKITITRNRVRRSCSMTPLCVTMKVSSKTNGANILYDTLLRATLPFNMFKLMVLKNDFFFSFKLKKLVFANQITLWQERTVSALLCLFVLFLCVCSALNVTIWQRVKLYLKGGDFFSFKVDLEIGLRRNSPKTHS